MESPISRNLLSPVQVRTSPSSRAINLTGTARKISDSAADSFNLIQCWNKLILKGSDALNVVADLKTLSLLRNAVEYPEGLQDLCDSLGGIVRQLEETVGRMRTIKDHLEALVRLEEFQKTKSPIFITWLPIHFANLGVDIFNAYASELQSKIRVVEKVAHCSNEKEIMYYRALWAYQIHVNANLEFRIESMLKETCHR